MANNVEVGIKVGESLTIQVTDEATGAEMQLTLTADGMFIPVEPIPPEPEPPEPDGITEKIYKPEEFAGDVTAMGQKIRTDQEAAGDGAMRAVVQFTRGQTYEYTDNQFMTGVQRYRCEAIGQGDRPKLRCVLTNAPLWILEGPLCVGKGANCFVEPNAPMSKTKAMALIANAKMGDEAVTLLNRADVSKLVVGRWHGVFSYSQQTEGYPPNVRWIDYVKVTAIENDVIAILDRPLAHNHWADYWENPSDEQSVGKARIGLWDGYYNDVRCCLEGTWRGLEFVGEHQAGRDVTLIESHIECLFEDCSISNFWPTMSKTVTVKNCVLTGAGDQSSEPDKLGTELIFDGVTQAQQHQYIQAATGWEKFVIKNSNLNCVQIKPRYLEVSDTVIDSHGDTHLYVPYLAGPYNGPVLEASFTNCDIRATTSVQPTWTYSAPPGAGGDIPLPLSASAWQGKKLIINRGFAGFENWLVWAYEGCMVFTGARVFNPGNYGRIDKIYAPPDGSQLWMDITWIKGTKPTSGNLNIPNKGLRKLVWNNTQITAGNWLEPDFVAMEGTPADRPFPQGIS